MTAGRLEIHTTSAKIEVSTRSTRLELHQSDPGFSITRVRGGLDIERVPPQLQVDSSACQAEEGRLSVADSIAQSAQDGMQSLRDLASAKTQDGQYILRNFHQSKHVIADIAGQDAAPKQKGMVFKFIPSQPPKVSFTDPVFKIDDRPDTIELNWNVSSRAQVGVAQTGGVDIRMAQYPSIQFDYIAPRSLDTTA